MLSLRITPFSKLVSSFFAKSSYIGSLNILEGHLDKISFVNFILKSYITS